MSAATEVPTGAGRVRDARGAGDVRRASRPVGRTRVRRRTGSAWLGLVAWLVGIVFFIPFAWMVLTSLHSETNAATNPPSLFAPLTLQAYAEFFGASTGTSPWPPLINSAMASVFSTVLVLALALPAAYALSIRPVQKWSDVMFFFLTTKMLPMVAGLLPIYLIAKQVGALDSIGLLVVLYTSMNLPIAVWMMRSFLSEIPVEILEAASLDGAGLLTIFRRVIIPISGPGLAATALICFIFSWNELLFASVLTSTQAQTAPVFLTSFVTSQGLFLAKVCAAAVAVSFPVLVAGFAAQDKLVQGLSLGAVK
jgi:sorbitol/mannitol transport system permease protein